MSDKQLLLCAPKSGKTNVYLRDAFQDQGWTVNTLDYRQSYRSLGPKRTLETLRREAGISDLVLIFKGEVFPGAVLDQVRSEVNAPVALWDHDPRNQKDEQVVERFKNVDVPLTMAEGIENWYAQEHPDVPMATVLLACHPDHHYPVDATGPEVEVGFIGTVTEPRGEIHRGPTYLDRQAWLAYLDERLDKDLHVWGSFPGEAEEFAVHHGRAEGNDGHREAVSRIKVNLGSDRNPEIRRSYGARLFWTLATGGFYLTNHTEGILEDFEGGLAVADTDAEFVNLINYFLEHDEERREVAQRGREMVLDQHTYTHRVEEILHHSGVT